MAAFCLRLPPFALPPSVFFESPSFSPVNRYGRAAGVRCACRPFAVTSSAPAATRLPAAALAARSGRTRRLARKRFWLLLAATLLVCLPFHPPAWHAALRTWLVWQARRHGGDLTIAAMDGGLFDTTHLHGVRYRQRTDPAADSAAGTDLLIDRADLTLAWTVPWLQRPAPSWVREVALEGVRGRWDLRSWGRAPTRASGADSGLAMIPGDLFARACGAVLPSFRRLSARLWPETFLLRAEDLRLEHGRYLLRATGLWLSGSRDDAGRFMARAVAVAGPGLANTFDRPHGETRWQGSRLTVSQLALGPDVNLASATLDGSRLPRQRLDWEGKLAAFGGEVRGQGAVDFSRERLTLEVAASLRGVTVRPLTRLLGVAGPADGLIDQGSFTFRGDPENWPAAQMWLAAHATDFRWGKRRWEDLDLQAVVVNRRVQVHRLELRQRANRLSLSGECPLPPDPADPRHAGDALRPWREGGFSCQVDARLEDLRALADLGGPQAPELAGRMSVNGVLSARPGAPQGVDGYLNVEGSRLRLRGASLDYLRSTLVFRDGGVRVADLQATHGDDYFTGTGSMRLDGPPRYEGELRARVARLAVYAPALAGVPLGNELAHVSDLRARLRWDESVLRFDQFQGRFDGASVAVGGTADLRQPEAGKLELRDVAITTAAGQMSAVRGVVYFLDGADGPASVSLVASGPGDAEVALFGTGSRLEAVPVGAVTPDGTPVAGQAERWPALQPASLPLPWLGDETPWANWLAGQSLPSANGSVARWR